AGGSKAKAKGRKAPAARAPRVAKPAAAGLRAIKGARHHEMAGVKIDSVAAANGQVKRVVYPPGFRWSIHMKPLIGTELCMHGHVGFLTSGKIQRQYADGCTFEFASPQVMVVYRGHDSCVAGREPVVLIQSDAAAATSDRYGMHPT